MNIEIIDFKDLPSVLDKHFLPQYNKETLQYFIDIDKYYVNNDYKVLIYEGLPLLFKGDGKDWGFFLQDILLPTIEYSMDELSQIVMKISEYLNENIALLPLVPTSLIGDENQNTFKTCEHISILEEYPNGIKKKHRHEIIKARDIWKDFYSKEVCFEYLPSREILGDQFLYWKSKDSIDTSQLEFALRLWTWAIACNSTGYGHLYIYTKSRWASYLFFTPHGDKGLYFHSFARNSRLENANMIGVASLDSVFCNIQNNYPKYEYIVLGTSGDLFSGANKTYADYKKHLCTNQIQVGSIAAGKNFTPPFYNIETKSWIKE